jgi:hypothetical protein
MVAKIKNTYYLSRRCMFLDLCNIKCKTWQDVLIEKGFEFSTSKSLIGFISWNDGEEFNKLGKKITQVLSGYQGKVFAKDVVSTNFNDKGLLFLDTETSEESANKIFDAIMSYEQNDVYNTLD